MQIIGKIWGETRPVLVTPLIELHHVRANPGGYCSKHLHDHKWNGFWVIFGELRVEVWQDEYDLVDTTLISQGQFTTVRPGLYHRFHNTESRACEFLEVYYLQPLGNDIIRETVGGQQ